MIDDLFVGYHNEYHFSYNDDNGTSYLAGCDGMVKKIVNGNTRMVEIKWNEKKVLEVDPLLTRQKLLTRNLNTVNASAGA